MRRMRPRRTVLLLTATLAVAGAGLLAPAVTSAAPLGSSPAASAATPFTNDAGKFTAVGPTRIMDTRTGLGGSSRLGAARTATLQVTGAPSGHVAVPATGAEAVVFNLTVVGPTTTGFVTAFPTGVPQPNVSSINFHSGWTGANLVTVKLGTLGRVSFYNSSGTTDLIVDVVGWYADGSAGLTPTGAFQPAIPNRTWDSRPSSPLPGDHVPIAGLGTLTEPVDFGSSAINTHVTAVVATLTTLNELTSGHLTIWSGTGSAPSASVLNYTAHTTVANLVIVPTIPCPGTVCKPPYVGLPSFDILNGSNGSTDILIDIWGFYDDDTLPSGERFLPLASPIRIVDTRKELTGLTTLGSASKRTKVAPASVAGVDTQLLVQNVTSIPASNTFLTFWRNGDAQPGVSNISPRAGRTVAGLAYTLVGANNDFNFYNAAGTNNVLVDVAGSMELPTAKAAAAVVPYTVVPVAAVG